MITAGKPLHSYFALLGELTLWVTALNHLSCRSPAWPPLLSLLHSVILLWSLAQQVSQLIHPLVPLIHKYLLCERHYTEDTVGNKKNHTRLFRKLTIKIEKDINEVKLKDTCLMERDTMENCYFTLICRSVEDCLSPTVHREGCSHWDHASCLYWSHAHFLLFYPPQLQTIFQK